MHSRTLATLDELDKAVWFSRVGVNDTVVAIVLRSWQEAMSYGGSTDWQDLILEAANQYCERLLERSKERFNKWNAIAIEVKKTTEPFVHRKTEAVIREQNLPPVFEQTIQWDILHVCMEAEYADVYPPGFFASHAYWYVKGHFPCGWQGQFPKGKLVVY